MLRTVLNCSASLPSCCLSLRSRENWLYRGTSRNATLLLGYTCLELAAESVNIHLNLGEAFCQVVHALRLDDVLEASELLGECLHYGVQLVHMLVDLPGVAFVLGG